LVKALEKKQNKTIFPDSLEGGASQDFLKRGKNLGKTKKIPKNKKTPKTQKNTSKLFGRGRSQPRLFDFFGFSKVFFGFGNFQQFAPFCTLTVRCLHAFKFAGTNRFTAAAMNILGLRIKTACSNFEMFGNVLDNSLSFMLYFFEQHVA
jgi:hypothetical protein